MIKRKRTLISIAMASLVLISMFAACVGTSASAATVGSSTSVKASPPGQPIPAGTGPSACSLSGSNFFYLFVEGYDGALWYRVFSMETGFWTGGWTSLGGKLTSSPCAVSRSSGSLDVYVRGTNGQVYERPFNGAWQGWVNIGGQLATGTAPAASGWAGREDVFIARTDGVLLQKTWTTASGWSGWASLGGKLTSSPAAVSRGTGFIDVHARGTNGADYSRGYYEGAWHDWYTLGGIIAPGTGPGLGVWHFTNTLYLLVTGTDGSVWQKTWTQASGWSGWVNLGGNPTSSPTAAWSNNWFAIEAFVRWSNGNVCAKEYYSGTWHSWLCGAEGPPCQNDCY